MFNIIIRNIIAAALSIALISYISVSLFGLTLGLPAWKLFVISLGVGVACDVFRSWTSRPPADDYTVEEIAEMEAAHALQDAERALRHRLWQADCRLHTHRLDMLSSVERAALTERAHVILGEFGAAEIDTIEAALDKLDMMRLMDREAALTELHETVRPIVPTDGAK